MRGSRRFGSLQEIALVYARFDEFLQKLGDATSVDQQVVIQTDSKAKLKFGAGWGGAPQP